MAQTTHTSLLKEPEVCRRCGFGGSTLQRLLAAVFRDVVPQLRDVTFRSAEQVAQFEREHLELRRTTGLDDAVLDELCRRQVAVAVADQRQLPEPEPAEIQRNLEDTNRQLRERYGVSDAEYWMKRTKAWVAKHPRLGDLLGQRGIGTSADVVLPIVEHVRKHNLG